MSRFLVGVDEVGRGPLAGPVVVCSFCVKEVDLSEIVLEIFENKIRDSKRLTKKKREEISFKLSQKKKDGKVNFKISIAKASVIDKYGINPSIKKIIESSILALRLDPNDTKVFLDGGLFAPNIFSNQETIIKGDSSNALIAIASILAKVYRDNLMTKFSKEFPNYKFEKNMGYGTKEHILILKKLGPSLIHRKTFIKNLI